MLQRVFILGIAILLCLSIITSAANKVSIDVAKSGNILTPYDTLYVGGEYQLRFWLENDYVLGGLTTGFKIWSDNGAKWKYVSQPDGIGMHQFMSIAPGSRMDSNPPPFDMTGLLVTEQNIDLIGHDSIAYGGVALNVGLQPGPLEHMVSMHFRPTSPSSPDEIDVICFDTSHIPPSACMFCFVDVGGSANMPLWSGQLCVPVKLLCGNPNGDNDVNVGDAVFMINYIFREGPTPDPLWLGDANCDGMVDVGDVVFLIAASFRYGPQPECCE